MSDISITAASVLKTSDTSTANGIAGETITAGMPVYINGSDSNKLWKCIDTSAAAAACVGVALHASLAGQPLTYATSGSVTYSSVLTVGAPLFVSDNAGGLRPLGDAGTGDYATLVGIPSSTTNLILHIKATGATVA